MKLRTILLTLALSFTAGALCFGSPMLGTWKLNETKSKFAPGAARNVTVICAMHEGMIQISTEGVDKDGKPTRSVWDGKFDEKDYVVALDPNSDTRSYKQIDANTLEFIVKKETKVVASGRVVIAPDGKTRTVTTTGTDADGKKFENVAVYDKQ